MKITNLILTVILGISTPIISSLTVKNTVNAQTIQGAIGTFSNEEWTVSLWYENNIYYYNSLNLNNGQSLTLSRPRLSLESTEDRYIYIWRNNDYQYQITWRKNDPDYLRLTVINPSNRTIVNTILQRNYV